MTDGPPAAATSARFVNLPLSPSKAKTTILSSSWNPTYSMSDIVHPPSPSAVGHARPQQSSPLINVYFRARPAATRPTRMGRRTHGMAYGVAQADTAGRCGRPRSSYLADPNASSTTSLRSAVHRHQLLRLITGFCGVLFNGGFHPPDPPDLKDFKLSIARAVCQAAIKVE